jgi:hypothetical protein
MKSDGTVGCPLDRRMAELTGSGLAANLKMKTGNKITRYPFTVTQSPSTSDCGNEAVQLLAG